MKKIALTSLLIIILVVSSVALTACANAQYAGTYEMVSVSGTMTANGQTIDLDTSLYEYYRIILKANGKAIVESKAATSGLAVEMEGEWEYKDNQIYLTTTTAGIKVIEIMDIEGDTITYTANQQAQGITINFTVVMKKQ